MVSTSCQGKCKNKPKDSEIDLKITAGTTTKESKAILRTSNFFFLCLYSWVPYDHCILLSRREWDFVLNFDQKHIKFVSTPFSIGWHIWVGSKMFTSLCSTPEKCGRGASCPTSAPSFVPAVNNWGGCTEVCFCLLVFSCQFVPVNQNPNGVF